MKKDFCREFLNCIGIMPIKDKELRLKYQREYRQNRINSETCLDCKNQAVDGQLRCEQHSKIQKEKQAARQQKNRDEGLCIFGCKRQVIPPSRSCPDCQHHYRDRWAKLKLAAINAYGGAKCACCSVEELDFLCIDHINGGGLKHRKEIGSNQIYGWLKKEKYPDGFQVLCWNCNHSKYKNGECIHQINKRKQATS